MRPALGLILAAALALPGCATIPATAALAAGATVAVPLLNLDTAVLTWYLNKRGKAVVDAPAVPAKPN